MRIQKEEGDMQNVILFQTVTKSGGEFVYQGHKKLKNKEI